MRHRIGAGFKRVSGAHIGRIAVKVAVCRGCDLQCAPGAKPVQCVKCGRLDFFYLDSRAEAGRYATLQLLEAKGVISKLERQVRFALNAARGSGAQCLPVKVAAYVADFVYTRDGKMVIEDCKGGAMTDVAALKLRWMEAMGLPVKLTKG